ncbi:MAG: CBS domain-containing protein [Bdellovibrionales bacterium]
MNKSIDSAMTKEPMSIAPDVSLQDAMEIMRSWGMRHLPVTGKQGEVIGLFTERDLWRYQALHPGEKASVRDAMTENPFVVGPDTSLAEVAEKMARHKYGCAIVAGENGLCGIFTTTDALEILAQLLRDPNDRGFRVMRIEDYIRTRAVA